MFSADGKEATLELTEQPFKRLSEIAALCNDSEIVFDEVCNFYVLSYIHVC